MKRNDLVLMMVLVGITWATPAHGYLDAGTGSLAIQMLIAGTLGGVFTIKSYWQTLMSKVKRGH